MPAQSLENQFKQLNDQYLEKFEKLDGWSFDAEEVLSDLLRALRRKKGFGLFFVQSNPAQAERIMASIQQQLPQKQLQQFDLNRESETLYGEILERYQQEPFAVACITGVEQALFGYEDTKRLAGWTSQEIYNYSWKGVPPLLSHLNRQREALEANLPVALVFLVRSFVIDYFIQRAPDFFDWRSGFFKFSERAEDLQKASQELVGRDYQDYLTLKPEQRIDKILEIKDKILQLDPDDSDQKSNLLQEQGRLFESGENFIQALDCYDRSLIINSKNHEVWNRKGILLNNFERYEEAIKSYEHSLEIKSDDYHAWHNRGIALHSLGLNEKAIESFDKALEIKPDYYNSWHIQGIALRKLGLNEKAIQSYDKALEINPDYYYAWHSRGIAFCMLGRYKEAVKSFDKALEINPSFCHAWHSRGTALHDLCRYKEAYESFDISLKIKSDHYHAWHGRGISLRKLGRNKEAIESFDKALEIKPNYYHAWHSRGISLHKLGRKKEAIESYDRSLSIQPDFQHALLSRMYALQKLGRKEEFITSFFEFLCHQPASDKTWHSEVLTWLLTWLFIIGNGFSKLNYLIVKIRPYNSKAWNNQGYLTLAQYSYGSQLVYNKPLLIRQCQYCSNFKAKTPTNKEHCQKSLEYLNKALSLDPNFIMAWANHSFPAYYMQQYQAALQSCDRALELNLDNMENINEVIYTNRGCILLQLQNPIAALQDFTTALTLAPRLDEAWIGQGNALYQLDRYQEAHDSFSIALALNHALAQVNLDLVQQHLAVNS